MAGTDALAVAVELAATSREAVELAGARADRLEVEIAAIRADVVQRSHDARDLLQAQDVRIVRLETQLGSASRVGSAIWGILGAVAAGVAIWLLTR